MTQTHDFDRDAVLARYASEREKRLRADGNDQFVEPVGALARFAETDPNVADREARDPVDAHSQVLIIGTGFSGILSAARLKEAGIEDFRMVDTAGDFGGTWYWNRYPGAQCDIESYCYLPLLEEMDYVPKEKYAFGDEIMDYCRSIGTKYDLYEKTLFQTSVTDAAWDEAAGHWTVRTDRGDTLTATFLIQAIGGVARAKLPAIEGIERFAGHSFHSSRWDYAYTGGGVHDDLTGLADKRVAVIGTGATGVQLIPRVAKSAKHLTVFQRTPSCVGPRLNSQTDRAWFEAQRPGWTEERRMNFLEVLSGFGDPEDLIRDAWGDIARVVRETAPEGEETMEQFAQRYAEADLAVMHERRRRVDETVKDPETAEALKTWYNTMCKRPTFSDEFLPAFNRDNVDLVDVSGDNAITEITEKGIVAGGREYEVDCIIYASGFQVVGPLERRMAFDVRGRDGRTLKEHWDGGMRTFHGFFSRGFPNWIYVGQGQTALAPNYTSMVDEQARHIAHVLAEARRRGVERIEPTQEAEDAWVAEIRAMNIFTEEFTQSCTPGYYNNEGGGGVTIWDECYGPGVVAFNALLDNWRSEGAMAGLELGAEASNVESAARDTEPSH